MPLHLLAVVWLVVVLVLVLVQGLQVMLPPSCLLPRASRHALLLLPRLPRLEQLLLYSWPFHPLLRLC